MYSKCLDGNKNRPQPDTRKTKSKASKRFGVKSLFYKTLKVFVVVLRHRINGPGTVAANFSGQRKWTPGLKVGVNSRLVISWLEWGKFRHARDCEMWSMQTFWRDSQITVALNQNAFNDLQDTRQRMKENEHSHSYRDCVFNVSSCISASRRGYILTMCTRVDRCCCKVSVPSWLRFSRQIIKI